MSEHHESIGKWISTIHRYSMIYKQRSFMQLGFGAGQWGYLSVLYSHDGISQDELAHKLNMDKTTTARAVKKLESLGYVTRKPDEADRRIKRVYLTPKSLDIQPKIQSAMEAWTEILVQDFTKEEREQLLAMLKKISDNAVVHIRNLEKDNLS